ncbi:uncharacterized protein isoform X2 [Choristoneura fumiferana]|uniref:uncharacterized protein isoform X2 n=1 Tax=Choristoneura fumiferana TaxID=7141 RepID=UPI003D156207
MKNEEDEDDDVTIGVSRYPCLPSLVALQQMRNRLHMAHDGKRLMKWSAMATGRELRRIAEDIDGVFHQFYEDVRNCFILLARCRYFFHNFNRMVLESVAKEACVTVNTSTKGVTGVRIALYEVVESGLDPYPHLGIQRGGETVLETKKAWLDLLRRLIHMLELRRSFMMLDAAHNNAQKGPNIDSSTMPYWDYATDLISVRSYEKKEQNFAVRRLKEIKVAEKRIAGSLHICKNCLAMFESHDKNVRGALCADCTKIETSTSVRKCEYSERFTTQKNENKIGNDMDNSIKVTTTISDILIDNCLKEEDKENSVFAKVKKYVWPYGKAVTCMHVKDKAPSKNKNKSNSQELGVFENKYRQIIKVVRSKNSDGSVTEERKTITIRTEKNKPSCSQATSAHSSSSVRKNTNVVKETRSKKETSDQNISKSQSKPRQTQSEKIALIDTLAAPRLKTSLSDDTIKVISIDSNNTKKADCLTTLKEKNNVRLISMEEKPDEPCVCAVPEKISKVRIKDVSGIHALRPARTLMELTNNQPLKSPEDSENVSLVSFATSYSLDEESINLSAQDVVKSKSDEDKTICTEVFDNKLEKDKVCSPSFKGQIGINVDEKTKIVRTNARWRDAGAATSDYKSRIFNLPSNTEVSTKQFSTNHDACGHVFEDEDNLTKIEQPDTSATNINASNATQTEESSFPIACQSTDGRPKLIDEFGFQLPTSKMFTNFPEKMENKNISNNHYSGRPALKSFDYKLNEMKRLEEMYKKMKNKQSEVVPCNSKPSTAFPRAKQESEDKLQSDSMSRLSHDIPIRTRMHNESPRVSGEIIYSHLDPKFVRKCKKATKGIKDSKNLNRSDAMVETDMKIIDIKMPVTESRGTSPVGSFPLIPLKIHEIIPNYSELPQRVTVATSPEFSLAKLPVISTSSQLTLTQNLPINELPKMSNIIPPDQRALESDSICEIKIVSKNFDYKTLTSEDTKITVERLKKLLKNNKVEDFDKIIYPTVKQLTKVPDDKNFSRPHIVCPVTPMMRDAASSCNSTASCPNPECPVKKICCPPKPEPEKKLCPPEKIDVAVSTFERDIPKRKVDFHATCKSTCSMPVELPKCAKCRATMMRADASTNTKTNARYDVRPLSKLIFTRVITETQSDSCLYCGKRCGNPRFRGVGQMTIRSPLHSCYNCTRPIPRAESTPTCRFTECDC